jgi:hypothetical protein
MAMIHTIELNTDMLSLSAEVDGMTVADWIEFVCSKSGRVDDDLITELRIYISNRMS